MDDEMGLTEFFGIKVPPNKEVEVGHTPGPTDDSLDTIHLSQARGLITEICHSFEAACGRAQQASVPFRSWLTWQEHACSNAEVPQRCLSAMTARALPHATTSMMEHRLRQFSETYGRGYRWH